MKSSLFVSNWAGLAFLLLGILTIPTGSSASPPFELPPQNSIDKAHKSLDSIMIDGQTTIPVHVIRRKLAQLPEIVEAMHPSVSQTIFRQRVVDATRRGYLACGFLDSEVNESRRDRAVNDGIFLIDVSEGPRFYCGRVRVTGASEQSNTFIKNRLLELATEEKQPKPIWTMSKPMNGSTLSKLGIENRVRSELSRMGCDGQAALIQFVRKTSDPKVDLEVELSKKDLAWKPDQTSGEKTSGVNDSLHALDPDDEGAIRLELLEIFRRNFEKPITGLVVSQREPSGVASMGVGDHFTWVQLLRSNRDPTKAQGQAVSVLLEKDVMLVAATPPAVLDEPRSPSWAIPNFNFGITIAQQAKSESTGKNAASINLSFYVNSDGNEIEANRSGFRFSQLGWEEWFPSESTTVRQTSDGRQFVFGANELTVDPAGDLVRLHGMTAGGAILDIRKTTDAQVRAACPAMIDRDNVREICVQRENSTEPIALTEIARDVLAPDKEDHKFFISAANGKKSLWGVLLLMVLNEENVIKRESLIGRFVEIYALQLSGYDRTVPERLAAIHREAAGGPITSFVLGDLYTRSGDLQKARQAYESAVLLSGHDRSVRRDLDLIVNNSNLVGQLAQGTDLKSLLQMGMRVGSIKEKDLAPAMQTFLAMMSEGTDQATRLENAKQLMEFLYESKLRDPLRNLSVHQISLIEARQLKIAAKAKKKKDDKAKKAAKKKRPLR